MALTDRLEGDWLRISEAARVLGVSEITVRRAAKKGSFETKLVPGPHGPTYLVWVEGAPPPAPAPQERIASALESIALSLALLVEQGAPVGETRSQRREGS